MVMTVRNMSTYPFFRISYFVIVIFSQRGFFGFECRWLFFVSWFSSGRNENWSHCHFYFLGSMRFFYSAICVIAMVKLASNRSIGHDFRRHIEHRSCSLSFHFSLSFFSLSFFLSPLVLQCVQRKDYIIPVITRPGLSSAHSPRRFSSLAPLRKADQLRAASWPLVTVLPSPQNYN